MNLFDQHPAEDAYHAAIAGHLNWSDAAEKAMRYLAERGDPFSADDLNDLLVGVEQPRSRNAIGGLFMSWRKQGLIRAVGGGNSRGPKRNGGYRRLWVGIQHEQKDAA